MPNFRKQATWNQLVEEILTWAQRGVSGIRFDTAQSWPLIFRPDESELYRGLSFLFGISTTYFVINRG